MHPCVQRVALVLTQGLAKCLHESSTGHWAMLTLLSSQAMGKQREELLKRNKQNLYDRPSAALCNAFDGDKTILLWKAADSYHYKIF